MSATTSLYSAFCSFRMPRERVPCAGNDNGRPAGRPRNRERVKTKAQHPNRWRTLAAAARGERKIAVARKRRATKTPDQQRRGRKEERRNGPPVSIPPPPPCFALPSGDRNDGDLAASAAPRGHASLYHRRNIAWTTVPYNSTHPTQTWATSDFL